MNDATPQSKWAEFATKHKPGGKGVKFSCTDAPISQIRITQATGSWTSRPYYVAFPDGTEGELRGPQNSKLDLKEELALIERFAAQLWERRSKK